MIMHETPSTIRRIAMPARIALAHGGGGQLTDDLVTQLILPRLGNDVLNELTDAAVLHAGESHIAMTIDSYVVHPWRFPGGDIGRLAVSGTVNDLAVCGAKPLGIALSLILAEGLERSVLEAVLDSIHSTAREADVRVVTGDTKVVGRGQADGIYITTAGVGAIEATHKLGIGQVQTDDALLINGPIADHGLAVMLAREMPDMTSSIKSDAAPLNGLIALLLAELGSDIAFMRDPTRSGLSGVAADLARASGLHLTLCENEIPIRPETRHASDMLGLDPLEVANEGKVVVVVRPDAAMTALQIMRTHPLGRDAAIIGRLSDPADGICEIETAIGGRRIIQKPYGEQLPRIC